MINKIPWEPWFLTLCFVIAQKSIDSTKHGCVIVGPDNTVRSLGFNGPPRNSIDDEVPLTRPLKYKWMQHSEIGAITFARQDLTGCTAYITGKCCSSCLRTLINVGIKKIIYGFTSSIMMDKDEETTIVQMLEHQNRNGNHIEFIEFPKDRRDELIQILETTKTYILSR